MHSKWILKLPRRLDQKTPIYSKLLSGLFLVTCCSSIFANNEDLLNKIQLLEKDFNQISAEFYQDKVNYTLASSISITNIDDLAVKVNSLTTDNRPAEAIQLIYNNIVTVKANLDHRVIFSIVEILLNHSEIDLAESLLQDIKNESDEFQLATIKFLFAKYYASQFDWSKVNNLLKDVTVELSEENSTYALLLQGTALQHLKLHRQAEEIYKQIPAKSQYYRHAQLNSAIAQIRQGWLTNAKNTIDKLTLEMNKHIDDEFTNRLYLVLGYAFLQKDYYRSSRDVFRKISQNSMYANRALLGITLCAINQSEFESALNTLSLLKDKKAVDLSTDESYLLISYAYEKLARETQVVASSTEAMNYYQNRIANLQSISKQPVDFTKLNFDRNTPVFFIQNHHLEYGRNFPTSFLINYLQLLRFTKINQNPVLAKKIEHSISLFDEVFQLIIKELIKLKVSHLNSYLNQARYGLAKLYDNSAQQEQ